TSHLFFFPPITPPPPPSTLFPYTTLFRSILEPAPNLHPARLEVAVSFPDENHLLLAGVEDRIRRHNDGHSAGRRHLHVGEHAGLEAATSIGKFVADFVRSSFFVDVGIDVCDATSEALVGVGIQR